MCLSPVRARAFIVDSRWKRYDPTVVEAFIDVIGAGTVQTAHVEEKCITSGQLQGGMVLSRDLMTVDGIMLLSANHVLNLVLIEKIRVYEKSDGNPVRIYVRATEGR